jgi:hypothetical protein
VVGGHGQGVGDEEDADTPGKGDPEVGADGLLGVPMVLTMGVTGWCSAKARTGPGMVAVATKAELMKGRKISG